MIVLERHNWSTGLRDKYEVNEAVLQEIVDLLFRSTRLWETAPDLWERKLRHWQQHLFAVQPIAAPEPVVPAEPVEEEPTRWPLFLAAKRREGLSAKDAAALWNARG